MAEVAAYPTVYVHCTVSCDIDRRQQRVRALSTLKLTSAQAADRTHWGTAAMYPVDACGVGARMKREA